MNKCSIILIPVLLFISKENISLKQNVRTAFAEAIYFEYDNVKVNDYVEFENKINSIIIYESQNFKQISNIEIKYFYDAEYINIQINYKINQIVDVTEKVDVLLK